MPKRDVVASLQKHAQWIDEALYGPVGSLTADQFDYRQVVERRQRAMVDDVLGLGNFAERFNRAFAEAPPYEERIPIW